MKKNSIRLLATILLAGILITSVFAMQTDDPEVDSESIFAMQTGSLEADAESEITTMISPLNLLTDRKTPTKSEDVSLKWKVSKEILEENEGMGWDSVPGTSVIVGDHLYVRIHGNLYKLSMEDGGIVATVPSKAGNFMYGHPLSYADHDGGIILDALYGAAYDLDLNQIYAFENEHYKMIYNDGYIYGLDHNNIVKYSADDEDPDSEDEIKEPVPGWVSTAASSQPRGGNLLYPLLMADYGYIITTDGINSFKLSDGSIVDNHSIEGKFNSEPTYYDGRIYVTTYTAGIFGGGGDPGTVVSIPVDTNTGELDSENTEVLQLTSSRNNSSLLICDGWGYVNCEDYLKVIDVSTMEVVAEVEGTYVARGNMAMSTGYITDDADGYKVHLYVIPYSNTTTITVYSHSFVGGEHILERTELTDMGVKQYNTETIIFGNNSELVWHNDAMYLYCYEMSVEFDDVTLTFENNVYDGNAKTPTVKLTDGTLLIHGEDYTLSGELEGGFVNASTYKVTVTGTGNYVGEVTKTFEIIKATMPEDVNVTVNPEANLIYTGNEINPELVVELGEIELELYTDYTVSYEDNIDAGSANAIVTFNNYTGSVTVEFTIKSVDAYVEGVIDQEDEPRVEISKGSANEVISKSNFGKLGSKTLIIDVVEDGVTLYSWTFEGEYDDTEEGIFKASIVTEEPAGDLKDAIDSANVKNPLVLNFAAEGKLSMNATVKYHVGDKYDEGATLTLFFYDAGENNLDRIASDLTVDENGYVEFSPPHFSQYVLTDDYEGDEAGSNTLLYVGVAIAVIAIIALIAVVVMRRQ